MFRSRAGLPGRRPRGRFERTSVRTKRNRSSDRLAVPDRGTARRWRGPKGREGFGPTRQEDLAGGKIRMPVRAPVTDPEFCGLP